VNDLEATTITYDVFEPFTGTVVLVLETPEVAAIAADILQCDWAPTGAGYREPTGGTGRAYDRLPSE
jgi:hypothetical protein